MAEFLGITEKEFKLALFFMGFGFLASMKSFLVWYNGLTPLEGLGVSYAAYALVIYLITHFIGLKVADINLNGTLKQTLGLLFITFAFFIATDFGESCWSSYVINGSCNTANTLNLFIATEDGSTFQFWSQMLPSLGPHLWAILTYVITPGLLAIIGAMLVEERRIRILG